MKDLEGKMNDMQKNVVNTNEETESITKETPTQSVKISENEINQPSSSNTTGNKCNKPSNPFVDTFREMKDNPQGNGISDLLKLFEQSAGANGEENLENLGDMGDIKNLYEILGKLSDNKDDKDGVPSSEEKVKLESLFGDLLEFLLKSDMLSEPLNQIKTSVNSYLEKNQGKLKPEEEDKYKSMLASVDTILEEIQKKEPNKELVIDIFYKLHEMSDIDSEILPQGDNTFKQFSDLFGAHK